MENENLVITRENYQGYLELFELRVGKKLTEQYQECDPYKVCYVGSDMNDETIDFMINTCSRENISDETKEEFKMLIQQYKLVQQETKTLKNKYPYLECNFGTLEIETSLMRTRLLEKKYDWQQSNLNYKIDYKMFEKYLKVRETLEDALLYGSSKYRYISACRTNPYMKIKKK